MTHQQRVQILKELPPGSVVFVSYLTRDARKAIKISDMENNMVIEVVITGNRFPISYGNLTCDTIVKAEAVTRRLQGHKSITG